MFALIFEKGDKVNLLLAIILSFSFTTAFSQVRWDGEGGDGQWNTPVNWLGDLLPVPTDDVLLDNSIIVGNYVVTLPSGTSAVVVKSLTISPGSSHTIDVILPSSNTSLSGFTASGSVYALVINRGGSFKNSSGAGSGTPVIISDSIRINDGGRYIHNSKTAHVANVAVLSRAPGTEMGIFEFDNPDASTTVSLSNRVFGKLLFSAVSFGSVNYTAAGTNKIWVRSDLEIGNGVTLNLNFADTLSIDRHFIQNSSTVNLGTSAQNMVVNIKGHLNQTGEGVLTETGTAVQKIILNGSANQIIDLRGSLTNNIGLTINNTSGATLQFPLSLPYQLELINGKINTTTSNLLTLLPACNIQVDSASDDSFIDGPLRKEGLSATPYFLFPVGKNNLMRWLELKNATGNFIVQYKKENPYTYSPAMGAGIHHVSRIEHWIVNADSSPSPSAKVELSFYDPNSGGVSSLSNLRVAHLVGSTWTNEGNIFVTGTPGAQGSVVSFPLNLFGPVAEKFTLASDVGNQNALPENYILFTLIKINNEIQFEWTVPNNSNVTGFEIQQSGDSKNFSPLIKLPAYQQQRKYSYRHDFLEQPVQYYRIKVFLTDSLHFFSKILVQKNITHDVVLRSIYPFIASNSVSLTLASSEEIDLSLIITDQHGRNIKNFRRRILKGNSHINFYVNQLPAGLYHVFGIYSASRTNSLKFIKK